MGLWGSLKHELFGQVNFGGDVTRENRVTSGSVNKYFFLLEHRTHSTVDFLVYLLFEPNFIL